MRRGKLVGVLLVIFVVCLYVPVASGTCLYSEPAAPFCSSPRVIPGTTGQHVVLMDVSTAQGTGTISGVSVGNIVYFEVTPEVSGDITVSTCHPMTAYDTVVDVSIGTCEFQDVIASNDDSTDQYCDSSCSGAASKITFTATAGTTYRIRVGSYGGNSGGCELCLGLIVTIGTPCGMAPSNIVCQTAYELPGDGGVHEMTVDATDTPLNTHTVQCGSDISMSHPVWFKFTAQKDGIATFSTCHPITSYDTVVRVLSGCSGVVQNYGCNDDMEGCEDNFRASEVSFSVAAGHEYFVEVGSYGSDDPGCLGVRLTAPECSDASDCDDRNPCTQDECVSGMCVNTPLPLGTQCPDDGNECTDDQCNGRGVCTHPGKVAGTLCTDDGNQCTEDVCDGEGTCVHPNEPAGTACGDPTETACDLADSCDGLGNCDPNYAASGASCSDGIFCNGLEVCSGSGDCTAGASPCGSGYLCDEEHDQCEPDCNGNGIWDQLDLETGTSQDCNSNLIPDECDPDGDGDTIPDDCDVCPGFDDRVDSDVDGVPDGCDVCPGADDTIDTDGDKLPDCADPDDDNDGMLDQWEIDNQLNPLVDDAMLDPDGDGYSNGQEYEADTDPHDPNSRPGEAGSYRGYFYTSGDVIVFAPEAGTNVSIRDTYGSEVMSFATVMPGEVKAKTGLPDGHYTIRATKRVSVLVGDPVSGSGSDCRGYYALAANGKPAGTKLYTYIRRKDEEDGPVLIIFSNADNNSVTIWKGGEFGFSQVWSGLLSKGEHQLHQFNVDSEIEIISDYPVSALVTGKRFYNDPASYTIPAISGSFYGTEFYTFSAGGTLFFSSYNNGTHIDLYDTVSNQKLGSWDLGEDTHASYDTLFNESGYYSIEASHPITVYRRFVGAEYDDLGMHYVADSSGSLIGTEFVIDESPPLEVIAYKDGTTVQHEYGSGGIDNYSMNAYEHVVIASNTVGKIVSNKEVSVVSMGAVGATYVPIPFNQFQSAPGPPGVFAVKHLPFYPTADDSSVTVKWATDEPCTSSLIYRDNGGIWLSQQRLSTFTTQHSIPIDISVFSGNDKIEYYVKSTDQDGLTTINNNNGKFYSFTIIPNVPRLVVTRGLTSLNSDGNAYTVNMEIQNTGAGNAEKVYLRERVTGLLPFADDCELIAVNDYQYDLRIPLPDVPAFGTVYFTYELVPILYGNYATYEIGSGKASNISYLQPTGDGWYIQHRKDFSDPVTLDTTEVLGVIKQKDYVIATSVGNLIKYFNAYGAGAIVREAAKFSLARKGVVTCLDIPKGKCTQCEIEKLIDSNWNGRLNATGWANGWEYLLFIGRNEIVPTLWHIFEVPFSDDRKAMFADNVYADIKEGDDYKPEIAIGRLPGRTAFKLIEQMENSLTPVEENKAVLISGDGDGEDEFANCIIDVKDRLNYLQQPVTHWKDLSSSTTKLNAFIADAPNADLVVFRDHGWKTLWGSSASVSAGNIKNIDFAGKHPMIWSIACWTGDIYQYCMADAFLEDANASLFIGSSDISPRAPNNEFARLLALYHSSALYGKSIGEVFENAKRKLIKDNIHWYTTDRTGAQYKQLVNEYNLFGDPKRGLPPTSGPVVQDFLTQDEGHDYGIPPQHIDIQIPDYEIDSRNGIDYVSLPEPNGSTYAEDGEPIVPTYIHTEYIDAGYKIQDVALVSRSEAETTSGLALPIASFAADDTPAPGPIEDSGGFFPNREHQFSWKVYEEIDGNQVVVITILPFYYNRDTQAIEFHRSYAFDIQSIPSSIAITDISLSQEALEPGEVVSAALHLNNNSGESVAVTVQTEILDNLDQVIDVVPPEAVTLDPGDSTVDVAWDSSGQPPGSYYLKETVIGDGTSVLDSEVKRVKLGTYSAVLAGWYISPTPEEGFDPGAPVEISTSFQNTCPYMLTGEATIRIRNQKTSEVVHEFTEEVELSPNQTGQVNTVWDTSGAQEGSYAISAFLSYDGKSTEPLSLGISTRKDIGISIQTEKDTYNLGEKVVVWAGFFDQSGNPIPDVISSSEVIRPDGSAFPLEITYYPSQDLYVGWFYLMESFADGVYEISLEAEKCGFKHGLGKKHIFVGIVPCKGNLDDDCDVDGMDLSLFARGFVPGDCAVGSPCEGDLDKDGDVDVLDLETLVKEYGSVTCPCME